VTDHPDWSKWVERNRSVAGELMPAYAGAAQPPAWNNIAGPGLQ